MNQVDSLNLLILNSKTDEFDCNRQKDLTKFTKYDEETGEPLLSSQKKYYKFHVPKIYARKKPPHKKRRRVAAYCREAYTLTNKKRVMNLKEEIVLGYNKTSHRMFLIPSLFFFTTYTAVLFTLGEIFLHVWAHRKNSRNKNPNIYYRSPLHILTAQFCGKCRSETECLNISKMHRSRKIYKEFQKIALG